MRKMSRLDLTKRMAFPCISEENYAEEMEKTVEPYLHRFLESGYLGGLYYELFPQENPRGTVVISHGYTESCVKYHEMIYYFHRQGYQMAVMEHRGHGKSVREVEKKCVVHIDSFSRYVEDLHGFIQEKVLPAGKGKPLFLYAHSMGGCIGSLYLEEYPGIFAKAVLNAPMLGIRLEGMPRWAADLACRFFIAAGKGRERVFTMEEFQEEEPFSASGASSRARHAFYREVQKKEEAYQTCCSTYSWVHGAVRAGKQALKKERAARIQIPVLVVQAEEDAFVTPEEQVRFVEETACGRLLVVPARHETFRAGNAVLEPYFAEVWAFLG